MEAQKVRGRDNSTFVNRTVKFAAAAALLAGLARGPEIAQAGYPLKEIVAVNKNITHEETITNVAVPSYLIPKYIYQVPAIWYKKMGVPKKERNIRDCDVHPSVSFDQYYKLAVANYKAADWHPDSELARMKQFAILCTNMDRISNGERPIVEVNEPSAQQHANSMLLKNYVSHWNTENMLPYMRYSIFGGNEGAVENCDGDGYKGHNPAYGIAHGLWAMMFSDGAADNGHRHNILDPSHTGLSIGISANGQPNYAVKIDEEFINNYIKWKQIPILENNNTKINFSGVIKDPNHIIQDLGGISITYNKSLYYISPKKLNELLRNNGSLSENHGGYAMGDALVSSYITTAWTDWNRRGSNPKPMQFNKFKFGNVDSPYASLNGKNFNGLNFNVSINLKNLIEKHGPGEYTLLMWLRLNQNAPDVKGPYAGKDQGIVPCVMKTFFIDKNGNQYNPELTVAMR